MPIIGYNAIGSENLGWTPNSVRTLYEITATMTISSVLGKGYLYCKAADASGTDSSDARILIYEIGANDANSPLIASSNILSISEQTLAWREFTFPYTILKKNKTYAVAFVAGGNTGAGEHLDGRYNHVGTTETHRTESGVSITSPPSDLTGFGTMQTGHQTSVYVEYTEPPSHVTPGSLYAPVDAIPTVTDGRGIGYEPGRDMRYALDNNPDTWWMPDDFGDNSLYVDLGIKRTVDALALWLHNYNEAYNSSGKTWQIAYSDDDSTYIPLEAVEFDHEYRAVVLSAFEPTAARYWRVTFSGFDDDPVGPRPEISAVWITAGYPLPWSHQRPESNKRLYLNNVSTARSGHKFSSAASVGAQRLIERRFVLTKGTGQWENLLGAYKASRGGGLPVIMKTELGSDAFYAVTFDSPLVDNRFRDGYREPRLMLRELGFDRVPFTDHSLFPIAETIGLWHMRGNGDDDSGEGHNLYEYESFVDGQWIVGASEHGITAFNGSSYARHLQLDAANAGDFDCDVSTDLSMEAWFRITPGVLTNYCRLQIKYGGAPITGFNFSIVNGVLYYGSGYDRVICQFYQDGGARQIHSNQNVQNPSDGEWHHVVVTLDRPTVGMQMYYDGEIITGNTNNHIVGMTDFSSPTAAFMVIPLYDGIQIDELAFHKGVVLSADEVAARYAGRTNYGTWGM
jgi:hypothetical protein